MKDFVGTSQFNEDHQKIDSDLLFWWLRLVYWTNEREKREWTRIDMLLGKLKLQSCLNE